MPPSSEQRVTPVYRLPNPQPTGALVLRLLDGDRWAADALYHRYGPAVFRVATLLLGRRADVDDVVQDAFVKAFRELPTLNDRSSFGPWVGRITANLARVRLRRRAALRRFGLDRGEEDLSLEGLALSVEARAELARIGERLRVLPAERRVAWTLRRVEGWAVAEIAEAVEASMTTVKRRVAAVDLDLSTSEPPASRPPGSRSRRGPASTRFR